ncbi:9bc6c35a-f1c2-4fd6-a9e9-ba170092149d [Sclerotinia trifoliorum]|uniref:9bc6c35a-f1c2-4fd6-a9e9-ba170092149d n=1 Tax=Sclerotinia trifoliorum TaxID=28548 RepID=A0A8H2ZV85_9HELO|nr:9bc6c35a-f1c2-4fd6-a9e9-ba170092149d [Sclerotinia trifoliorum]
METTTTAADYIPELTQSQQLAIARNSSIQITNGAVLTAYERNSTVGDYTEFGSRGEKRGLESPAEADGPSSQRRQSKLRFVICR